MNWFSIIKSSYHDKEELKEKYPNPKENLNFLRVNTLEMFISEFFDYSLIDVAGKTTRSENTKFTSNQHYIEQFTDEDFHALTLIKNDLPKLVTELLKLLYKYQNKYNRAQRAERNKRYRRKNTGKKRPYKKRKPQISDRRDIL